MTRGFTGISFPFRIGVKGGVVMSSTSVSDASHILESLKQILLTRKYERGMEFHIYSDLDTDVFSMNDQSSLSLIEHQITEAIERLEPRVEVVSIDMFSVESEIHSDITFKLLTYDKFYNADVRVGELNAESTD